METLNKKLILVVVIIIVFFVFLFSSGLLFKRKIDNTISYLKIAGETILVGVSVTPEELARGLSGRDSLEKNQGMLFVFDQPAERSFWMKDMNFPIDIIWLGMDKKVTHIEKDVQPESYPATFSGGSDALYVLEVNAGFSDKHNLRVGDQVFFGE
ncbi:MAG: DUF192 domain-containing protein [Candidatus Paceibacterota bacterium]|jgi:hypothetical protein